MQKNLFWTQVLCCACTRATTFCLRKKKSKLFSPLQLRKINDSCHNNSKRSWKQPEGYNTGVKIYHPLVKEKVPLILPNGKLLKWYACGPTVYDSAHIGHASSYVRQDVVRRILQSVFDIDCVLVMGVTNVDDKIIAKAKEKNKTVQEISSFFQEEFFSNMSDLNVLPPTMRLGVLDHIPIIISFIEGLQRLGLTYQASDGSVYFDVEKYGHYGIFHNPPIEEDESSLKKSPRDFALWKSSKPGEIKWNSPWGEGRPGWHIECSAMASNVLGSNFDLHSGGEDLMFPHHENELAQSCAFHQTRQWVNYWLYTGHLHILGQEDKMSKSLKNTISVSDFLESYTSDHFRMMCLLSTYSKKIDFNDDRMAKAVTTVSSFKNFLFSCDAYVRGDNFEGDIPEAELYQKLEETKTKVSQAYADDFNTPRALANLMRLVKFANQVLKPREEAATTKSSVRHPAAVAAVSSFIQRQLALLGMESEERKKQNPSKLEKRFHSAIDVAVLARDKVRILASDKRDFLETAAELEIPRNQAAVLKKKFSQNLWDVSDDIRIQLLTKADVEIRDKPHNLREASTWKFLERVEKIEDKRFEKSSGGKAVDKKQETS